MLIHAQKEKGKHIIEIQDTVNEKVVFCEKQQQH